MALLLPMLLTAAGAPPKPNLLFVMADDLGFYDTALYNPDSPTPGLAALAKEGMLLDRHYVFRYCSPTRRSFLSGRFPNHLTTVQPDGANLCSDFLPLAVDIITEKLATAGYQSHFVGKGHLGYQTMDHLPINRGFKSHVGYLGGSEGYANGGGKPDPTDGHHDMWQDDGPGVKAVEQMFYSANYYGETAVNIVNAHDAAAGPLFMYFAIQNVHSPYTIPPSWECQNFPLMWDHTYANMLHLMDSAIVNVTDTLKKTQLWDNSLIVFTADNGGVGRYGNNFPLRGHKHDPWDGGTRAAAFITGGFVPAAMRGTASGPKLVHVSDWYATFSVLAGVDPSNPVPFNGTVRDIDGVNVWPMLTGANATQPRPITPTSEAGIIEVTATAWIKVVTLAGQSNYYSTNDTQSAGNDPCLAARQPDPPQPGRTDPIVNGCPVCNMTQPCVYDVLNDPAETTNIVAAHPDAVAKLVPMLTEFNKYYVSGRIDAATSKKYKPVSKTAWGTFDGPCLERI